VEQYERIELAAVPTTQVAGRVVNDLVHLLAELLENATSFSSPQTKVKVTGHALPDGRVLIEIHDTGIGLSPEDLAAINERLASPPTVDVSVSRRMGLFVVGRLSQRHGIRIQLRPSDSGGTTALVMLPVDVAQGGKKPQPKQGQGPGVSGGPAAAQAAAGAAAARRQNGGGNGGALGSGGAGGGLLGAGQGPRAALPGRDAGGRPGAPGGLGGPGGARGPQAPGPQAPGPQQGRPAPAGAGAPQGLQAAGPAGAPQGQESRGPVSQRRGGQDGERGGRRGRQARQPQLPPRGGPRAELPGGNPQPRVPSWSDENAQPPVPRASLDTPRGHEEPDVSQTSRMPRADDRQGPGATAEMPAIGRQDERQVPPGGADFGRPGAQEPQQTGQFVRPDVFGTSAAADPSNTGGFPVPQGYDNGSTGQFAASQGYDGSSTGQSRAPQAYDNGSTGQYPAAQQQAYDNGSTGQYPAAQQQGYDNGSTGQYPAAQQQGYDNGSTGQYPVPAQDASATGRHALPGGRRNGQSDFGAQRAAQRPQQRRPEPEALPPASGPGDGRTPLYDTLETNWFHGQQAQQGQQAQDQGQQDQGLQGRPAPQARAERPAGNGSAPDRAQPQAPTGPQRAASAAWRSSPNDDLVKQAERVRQPAAGGVTTSGLPRRVPRANLVPGTAQQQPNQSGPQVSRAPQDVRGRLTNLRRGIAQGRQAGSGQTGSFPSPTHPQER
jgi:hypothetical protein